MEFIFWSHNWVYTVFPFPFSFSFSYFQKKLTHIPILIFSSHFSFMVEWMLCVRYVFRIVLYYVYMVPETESWLARQRLHVRQNFLFVQTSEKKFVQKNASSFIALHSTKCTTWCCFYELLKVKCLALEGLIFTLYSGHTFWCCDDGWWNGSERAVYARARKSFVRQSNWDASEAVCQYTMALRSFFMVVSSISIWMHFNAKLKIIGSHLTFNIALII